MPTDAKYFERVGNREVILKSYLETAIFNKNHFEMSVLKFFLSLMIFF